MDDCPYCGLKYEDLRTGLTFAEVRQMLWVDSPDSDDWKYKRRHGVLGMWHGIKKRMMAEHIEMCKHYWKEEYGEEDLEPLEDIPF